MNNIACAIQTLDDCIALRNRAKRDGRKFVLTNGCFDILHRGHAEYLQQSREMGDLLVVAVNSDISVSTLKGPGRPINCEADRAMLLSCLSFVDAVTVFPGPRLSDEIRVLRPDIYTKAGDYTIDSLDPSERSALIEVGADIKILPFVDGYSTTSVLMTSSRHQYDPLKFDNSVDELRNVLSKSKSLSATLNSISECFVNCLRDGGKILTCGNGGSAADALHLSEELVGKFRSPRKALGSVCLNADVAAITCIANDFGYDSVFSRSVEALGKPGDILVGFSTSGNSPNVLKALKVANEMGLKTVLISGETGGQAASISNFSLLVPSTNTARIQEVHTLILHQLLEIVEVAFPA